MLLPDHPTPVSLKTHTADPVPFVICSSDDLQEEGDSERGYNEPDAAAAKLVVNEGWTLMDRFLK